jgi:proteasome lid subunit RPN8/RPN11
MLRLPSEVYLQMIGHCIGCLPEEACGLLGGDPVTDEAWACYPVRNVAASARVYTVDPLGHLKADREAEAQGGSIVGVFHSHTHTDAFPSPTDVEQAPDPMWHYVIVSLRDSHPVVRSYTIVDHQVTEESVVLLAGHTQRTR